ncbi:STAS domain-containing protein [Polyangium aurulentum]|uniref:STAS domain-containing protein n=1 Tax=Polyangium aurulentum TaxID=2567896 RepID=UPI001F3B58E6|nr:STAS domain-containing protein [Polyangium aurulentum]
MTMVHSTATKGKSRAQGSPLRVQVGGVEVTFEHARGMQFYMGLPTVTMWTESSMAGLMLGMQRMVGTERFNLALQSGGRDSVDGDWEHIQSYATFEEGMRSLAKVAASAGWGLWELVSIDRERAEARFRCKNGWECVYQRSLDVCWGSSMMAGKFAGLCTRLFGKNCWAQQTAFQARGDDADEFWIRPSDVTVEGEIERLLGTDEATRADLAVALEKLRREVAERRETEEALRRSEQEKVYLIEQQKQTIQALSTPIIQVWDGVVTLPIVGMLGSTRAETIMVNLLQVIVDKSAQYAILDVTGVDSVDAETADHIVRIMRAVELLGARAIVSGIRPKVAQALVEIGVDLSALGTAANLQEALKGCFRAMGVQTGGAPAVSMSRRRI